MLTASERSQRARIAANRRHRPTDPETERLARDFKAQRLEDYVKRAVDAAPPLNAEQRQKIAALLTGGGQLAG